MVRQQKAFLSANLKHIVHTVIGNFDKIAYIDRDGRIKCVIRGTFVQLAFVKLGSNNIGSAPGFLPYYEFGFQY